MSQASQKYIAAYIPRYMRTSRLWYLPPHAIIGSKQVGDAVGANAIYDVIMLPEKEYMRARLYLGAQNMGNNELRRGAWTPAFVPQFVREIDVRLTTKNPRSHARRYFQQAFGPDISWYADPDGVADGAPSDTSSDMPPDEDMAQHASSENINYTPPPEATDPYVILGLKKTTSDLEIKRKYRTLIRMFHPDRLAADNLTPEELTQATARMQQINGAYDTVCKARGIK